MSADLVGVIVVIAIGVVVGGAGVALGMLIAPRIDRHLEHDEPAQTAEETGDHGTP
jgi:hypothetical protein